MCPGANITVTTCSHAYACVSRLTILVSRIIQRRYFAVDLSVPSSDPIPMVLHSICINYAANWQRGDVAAVYT